VSVYNRGGYWHFDFVHKGQRYRGSTDIRATTKKPPQSVRDLVAKRKDTVRLGASSAKIPTIEAVAQRWFQAKVAGKKSEATTAIRLEIMLSLLGRDTLISDIDEERIDAVMQARRLQPVHAYRKMKRPRMPSNSTVNRDIIDTTLRPILRYARKILRHPIREIAWTELRLDEPRERIRSFTPEETAAWRSHLPAWHRPVFDFMALYGPRLGNVFFAPDDVNVDGRQVTFRNTKNGRDITIPLLPADATDFAARISRARAAKLDTIWFREMKDGELRPIKPRGFQSASRTALERAGISNARPAHDLRHHAATAALKRSRNLASVKKLLGHDHIASTMRYAHADDADVLIALGHKIPHSDDHEGEKPLQDKAVSGIVTGT
jgi:hypothetical protein